MRIARASRSRRHFLGRFLAATTAALLTGCDAASRNSWLPKMLGLGERASRDAQRLASSRRALPQEFSVADLSPQFRSNGTALIATGMQGVIYAANYAIDPTGVADSSVALNAAIQDAIAQKKKLVLPTGIFLLDSPLFAFNGVFSKIEIEGQGGAIPNTGNSASFPSWLTLGMANTVLCMNSKVLPCIIFQSNRNCVLKNLAIVGLNSAPSLVEPTDVQANYVASGCRATRYSPYCGICIDPFTNTSPPDGGYPGLMPYNSAFSGNGTSGLIVENVWIAGFVCGVALSVAGTSIQGDICTFNNVNIAYCDSGYVCGDTQARCWTINGGSLVACREGINTLSYGTQTGCPPILIQNLLFMYLYRWLALAGGFGAVYIEGCYAESIKELGQLGKGYLGRASPIIFSGCHFNVRISDWPATPILFESYAPTSFRSCVIANNVGTVDAWNIVNGLGSGTALEQCFFTGSAYKDLPPHIGIDFHGKAPVRLRECWTGGANGFVLTDDYLRSYAIAFASDNWRLRATWQTRSVQDANLTYLYQPYLSTPAIGIAARSLTISGSTLTFTETLIGEVQVNDILLWLILKQGYSLVQWAVPAWKVTSVNTSTGACVATALYKIDQYDMVANAASVFGANTVQIVVHQWAPTAAMTGTTATDTTLTSVTPPALINGDWVIGAGIPVNARVVSGGGTSSLVLSKATTASASGVTLYYGRLLLPTTTIAF
jgi:hypothetical protein